MDSTKFTTDSTKTNPDCCRHHCDASSGFSMLELLITIAIVGIFASLALPAFGRFVDKEKTEALATEFSSSLANARSAAIKSGSHVIFCPGSSGTSCSTDWNTGWHAFQDDNKDGDIDSGEPVLLIYQSDSSGTEVSVTNSGTAVTTIRFDYRGTPNTLLTASFTRNSASNSVSLTPFGKSRIND